MFMFLSVYICTYKQMYVEYNVLVLSIFVVHVLDFAVVHFVASFHAFDCGSTALIFCMVLAKRRINVCNGCSVV